MAQALYRKWRPRGWDEVLGQPHVIQTLRNAVAGDRIGHAYLFAGPRGTGKTSSARLLAKAANCLAENLAERPCGVCDYCRQVDAGRFLDLIEIDAASNTSVEDVRDLRDKINFSPNQGKFKVYIIDEVHMLSTAAFNALLKTLEEPPPHAIFILATTEVHKIPATVLSRCQRHEFRRIPVVDIVTQLEILAEGENIEVEREALQLIARQATGAMRDAISLLDQLSAGGETITLAMAQEVLGTAANQAVLNLVQAALDNQVADGLATIHQALDAGSDPRQFARQIVDYLRDLLLIRSGNAGLIETTPELRAQMAQHAQAFSSAELLRIIRLFTHAASDARSAWQPALPLEVAFVETLEAETTGPPASAPAPTAPPAARQAPVEKSTPASAPAVKPPAAKTQPAPVDESELPDGDRIFKQVKDNWRRVLAIVRQENPQTQGLLNSCQPYGMRGNTLFLGFNGEFAKSKMEKGEHIALARRALAEIVGSEIPIRCFVASGHGASLPPEVESDGMVAAALRDLGGEIVDVQ